MPPYKVGKSLQTDGNYYHYFESYNYIQVKTDTYFWKLKIFFMRWIIFSRNMTLWTFRYMIFGEYGLKGLLQCNEYYIDYSIDSKTGEIKKNKDK